MEKPFQSRTASPDGRPEAAFPAYNLILGIVNNDGFGGGAAMTTRG
jgi:hypothetical protein